MYLERTIGISSIFKLTFLYKTLRKSNKSYNFIKKKLITRIQSQNFKGEKKRKEIKKTKKKMKERKIKKQQFCNYEIIMLCLSVYDSVNDKNRKNIQDTYINNFSNGMSDVLFLYELNKKIINI